MGDALAKLERGQYIMIREGTAARNLDALLPLLTPQYYTCLLYTSRAAFSRKKSPFFFLAG